MKVSGFTIVRNGIKYDYPFIESIQSILPVCDEMIVAVGNSEDETLEAIKNINSPKIKIIETVWDDSLREGGRVLAVETNKAFDAISDDSDWAFYIQADEVFHEADLPKIKKAMEEHLNNPKVEGLVFKHLNFYGTYDYIADSHKWMKNEVRVVRNDKSIRSWKDAMSFRKHGKVLAAKFVEATIYHYGWVKHPEIQQKKREAFEKLWHDDDYVKQNIEGAEVFDYSKIDSLKKFEGSHPKVMQERISKVDWQLDFDPTKSLKTPLRIKFLNFLEKLTGKEIGRFKNYKKI
ncbi:MAG: hypothetical protein Kow0079_08790 [Vicingaceae bacterium]